MEAIRLYLADDDKEDREIFIEALGDIPLRTEVTQFDNGVDLMDNLFSMEKLPDVIFLDLYMPIMDGFECLMDIRNFSKFDAIKIVVYSTSFVQREVNQLREDGADQYLQKPTSYSDLKALLLKSLMPIQSSIKMNNTHSEFVVLL